MRGRRNLIDIELMAEKIKERRGRQTTVYTGDYLDISLDNQEYENYKKRSILIIALITIFHIGAGFINNPGMYEIYVVIPYVSAFLSLVYYCIIRSQLPKEKNKFRMGEVDILFNRTRNSSIILGISLLSCVIGEIAFIWFISVGDQLALDYIFLALEVFGAAVTYFLIRTQVQIAKKISIA